MKRTDVSAKKDYLQRIRKLREDRDSILDEINELREERQSAPSMAFDGAPRAKGVVADLSGYMARLDALERKLIAKHEKRLDAIAEVEDVIEGLEDPTEAAIIRMYYILGKSWDDVAETVGFSTRQVFRIHGHALLNIDIGKAPEGPERSEK